jgi:small-conductance mechanosensitive channel
MNDARTTLQADFAAIVAYIPHLVAAAVILLAGILAAFVAGFAARTIAARLGLDRAGERSGLRDDLENIGMHARLSFLLGRLVFAIVALATLVQVVDALALTQISDALRQLLSYAPRIVLAGAIVLGGAVLGDLLARTLGAAAKRADIAYDGVLTGAARGLVIVLSVLMALQQLTIEATFLLDVLIVALAGGALAFAIAAGWGGRTFVENVIAARYVEQHLAVGDGVNVAAFDGVVESVGLTGTVVRTSDGSRAIVPNAIFASSVVRRRDAVRDNVVSDDPADTM